MFLTKKMSPTSSKFSGESIKIYRCTAIFRRSKQQTYVVSRVRARFEAILLYGFEYVPAAMSAKIGKALGTLEDSNDKHRRAILY